MTNVDFAGVLIFGGVAWFFAMLFSLLEFTESPERDDEKKRTRSARIFLLAVFFGWATLPVVLLGLLCWCGATVLNAVKQAKLGFK